MHMIDVFFKLPYASTTIEVFVKPLSNFFHNVLFCLGKFNVVSFYICRIKSIRYLSVGPFLGEGFSTTGLNNLANSYIHIIFQENLVSIRLLAYMIEEIIDVWDTLCTAWIWLLNLRLSRKQILKLQKTNKNIFVFLP